MVYCGKASQGCQGCRIRRIKCDKVRPQCTQCIRIGKTCPGYRDQLALLFRDESSKVIQKAHAQWGVTDPSDLGEPSGSSLQSISPYSTRDQFSGTDAAIARSRYLATRERRSPPEQTLPKEVSVTTVEKGIQFYLEHYVIGLPDEPRVAQELQGLRWIHSRATRDIMAAVGLAGLSNLTGDRDMSVLARQQYGLALQNIASSLRDVAGLDLEIVLRAVVMMAMFEVVRRKDEPVNSAPRTHIMGGAAILTTVLPISTSPIEALRGLLQICFSILAAIQNSLQSSSSEPNVVLPTRADSGAGGGTLPSSFFDWISMSATRAPPPDRPAAELISMIVRLVQLSVLVRYRPLVDGQPGTANVIRQALELDAELDSWENRQEGIWTVTEEHANEGFFPAGSVFEDCYHVYSNMHTARVWSHLRWARVMVSQMLLESVAMLPLSSSQLVPAAHQKRSYTHIKRLARDILVSIPTHYRHPNLKLEHYKFFDEGKGGAHIGIAGIPSLLFGIKVASCAPGVPHQYRMWGLRILETVWCDTGMFQAKMLADLVRKKIEQDSSRVGN